MDIDAKRTLLLTGSFSNLKPIPIASNASIFCTISDDSNSINAIYKPIAGERPLWDFQNGNLASREYASFLIDRALGINSIPTTVLRDGPYGLGALQLWIDDLDENENQYIEVSPQLRNIALLDVVINNTDRKIGHLLFKGNLVFACDHGVTFHPQYKLRTVLWQFAGMQLNAKELNLLQQISKNLPTELHELLTPEEIHALHHRIDDLIERKIFPYPPTDWPAIPWPPF